MQSANRPMERKHRGVFCMTENWISLRTQQQIDWSVTGFPRNVAARRRDESPHGEGLWRFYLATVPCNFLMDNRMIRFPARKIGTSSPIFKRTLPVIADDFD